MASICSLVFDLLLAMGCLKIKDVIPFDWVINGLITFDENALDIQYSLYFSFPSFSMLRKVFTTSPDMIIINGH